MLYLGIDQHARQITISLRDDSGDAFGSVVSYRLRYAFTSLKKSLFSRLFHFPLTSTSLRLKYVFID